MGAHTILSRNLGILIRLKEGPATIEELAKTEACPQGLLRTPLQILFENDFITFKDDKYSLNAISNMRYQLLDMIKSWTNYRDDSNYTLARDMAKIIHEYAYSEVGVESVILFGSTLKKNRIPGDIDMVLVHNGIKLQEFYKDPYGEHKNDPCESDKPAKDNNRRITSTDLIRLLGYKDDGCFHLERSAELWQNSAYTQIVRRLKNVMEFTEEELLDSEKYYQFERNAEFAKKINDGINSLLDLHAIKNEIFFPPTIWREEAIQSCRDPTFWYTVFSEGMIYDTKTQDFTIIPSERYNIELLNVKK